MNAILTLKELVITDIPESESTNIFKTGKIAKQKTISYDEYCKYKDEIQQITDVVSFDDEKIQDKYDVEAFVRGYNSGITSYDQI